MEVVFVGTVVAMIADCCSAIAAVEAVKMDPAAAVADTEVVVGVVGLKMGQSRSVKLQEPSIPWVCKVLCCHHGAHAVFPNESFEHRKTNPAEA